MGTETQGATQMKTFRITMATVVEKTYTIDALDWGDAVESAERRAPRQDVMLNLVGVATPHEWELVRQHQLLDYEPPKDSTQ